MTDVYITYAKRTAIGRFAGTLSTTRIDDILAELFKDFKSISSFDLEKLDDIIVGCANQAGEDNRNIARMASLLAEFPFEVPGTTINRLCGSSLDATADAFARIKSGLADAILVGGAESMSRAPLVMSKANGPYDRNQKLWDTAIGWRFPNKKMEKLFPLYGMGETAEEVASLHKITREEQDQFALSSHQKAVAAIKAGKFKEEILPIEVRIKKDVKTFSEDEGPRADTSLEKLSKLRAAFRDGGTVTAGNSSSINDGAACLLVVSEKFMKDNNLTPLARITGMGVRGCHPNTMGLGPVEAVKTLCNRYQKKVDDFDIIELNEAFSAQSLGCIKELNLDKSKINLNGGAISLGHPLGCSGARILTTLLYQMKNNPNFKQGLATMCIGLGQGIALSVEKA